MKPYPPPHIHFTDPSGQPTFKLSWADNFDPAAPEFIIEREEDAGRMIPTGAFVAEEGQLIHSLLSELCEAWRIAISCSRVYSYGEEVPGHEIRERAARGFGWAFNHDTESYYAGAVEPGAMTPEYMALHFGP